MPRHSRASRVPAASLAYQRTRCDQCCRHATHGGTSLFRRGVPGHTRAAGILLALPKDHHRGARLTHVRHRRHRAPRTESSRCPRATPLHVCGHPPPGARRRGAVRRRWRRPRHATSQHYRFERWPTADLQRRRVQGHRLQRRDLQLSGAPPGARRPRPCIPLERGHGNRAAPLRGDGTGLRHAAAGDVRVRDLGRSCQDVVPRPGPIRDQAALRGDCRVGARLRLRAEGAAVAGLTSRALDWEALDMFFQLGYIPAPAPPFLDVRKLEPGHTLTWRGGDDVWIRQYWDLPSETGTDAADVEEQVRQWLDESVTAHLVSDVPVAAFLSGGLDSSAVVSSMALVGEKPQAFTARYFGSGADHADEPGLARALAARYRAELRLIDIRPELGDIFEPIAWALDEPHAEIGRASCRARV